MSHSYPRRKTKLRRVRGHNPNIALKELTNVDHIDLSELEWHTISTEEALRRLSASMTEGLSTEQVTRRMKEYGRNAPSPPDSRTIQKYLGYFFKGFGPILLLGAILVFISWKPLGQPPSLANLVSNNIGRGPNILQVSLTSASRPWQ